MLDHQQRLLGFGAAADLTHPATGYHLTRALRLAPVMAAAIRDGLNAGGPAVASRSGWDAIRPPRRERAWAVYAFGAALMSQMNQTALSSFFDAFFRLSADDWRAFLSGEAPLSAIARSMAQVYHHADPATRRLLRAAGLSSPGAAALRAVASI